MDPASIGRDLETDALEVLQILYAELSEDWRYRDGTLWNTPTLMLAMMGSFATVLLDVDKLPAWISVFVSSVISLVIFLILLKNVRDRYFASGTAHLLGEIERIMSNCLLQNKSLDADSLVRAMNEMKGKGGALRKVKPQDELGGDLAEGSFFGRIATISSTGILLRLNVLILIVSVVNTIYLVLANSDVAVALEVHKLLATLSPLTIVLIPLLVFLSVVGICIPGLVASRKRARSLRAAKW